MDPRPYHYEYRRPRLNNPTYQSMNLYESLYHRGILNRYENRNNINTFVPKNQFQRQIYNRSVQKNTGMDNYSSTYNQRKQSPNNRLSNSVVLDSYNPETNRSYNNYNKNPQNDRPYSNRSTKSNQMNKINDLNIKQRSSVLASYGKNSMGETKTYDNNTNPIPFNTQKYGSHNYDHLNRFSIYKKQQKPFNIIGNYPRSTSTDLKKYPKLTLENKLIQQGRFAPL